MEAAGASSSSFSCAPTLTIVNMPSSGNMTTVDVHPGLPQGSLNVSSHDIGDDLISPNNASSESLKRSFAEFYASGSSQREASTMTNLHFDPELHLVCDEPKVHTMDDIGLPATYGISHVAVSEPFRLFTEQAVDIMRAEILADEVQAKYSYTSDIAPKQIRGYAPAHCKFVYEAWKHPKTLALISKIAGVDLVPVVDYEIGHVNISVPGAVKKDENGVIVPENDEKAVVDWHRDSYPFVCVLMLSDASKMIGGETALKTASGEIKKVRGPQRGCAAVLQGRYIEHQAMRAFGSQERITMVTSFRPRSPFVKDDTVLNTVRPISDLSDLYAQVAEYQLENTEARLRRILKVIRESNRAGATDVKAIKDFLDYEVKALAHLNEELVPEENVVKGAVKDICVNDLAAFNAANKVAQAAM